MKNLEGKNMPYPYNVIKEVLMYENISISDISEDMVEGYYYALTTLPKNQQGQEIVELKFKERMTYSEIGEKLGENRDTISRYKNKAFRQLRHPSRSKYIKYGLKNVIVREEKQRQNIKKHDDIQGKEDSANLPLKKEELGSRAYSALYRKGFGTLNEVNEFIKESGENWWKDIRNIGAKTAIEVENVIKSHGLNND